MAWYKTGSVSVNTGQTSVTATGTKFATNVRVGDGFRAPDGEWYEITNIASETVLGIYPSYQGATVSNSTDYMIAPLQGYNKESADRLRAITDSIRDFSEDVEAAAASAAAALVSENAAKVSETNAKASELAAKTSELNADASADAADVSEANALASATIADTAANDALASEQNALDSAAAALVSENNAQTSENAAKVSETNSKTSETNSKASELAAQASETNADTSETNAAASASTASTAATTATNAATSANADADRAEVARDDAIAAAATVTGNLMDMGPADLSSGVYPTKPAVSSFWKVTVGGSATDAGETISYGVGDTLVFSKPMENFYKIDNTESVSSVAGKTGVVTLVKGDVGLPLVDNTSDVNKPVSTAQQTALDLKVDTADIVDNLSSTDVDKPLSAKQGKTLFDLVQASNNTLAIFEYTATLNQTVFTGADIHGFTMVFNPGPGTIVYQNGVQLQITVDYTTTGTGTVTLVKPVEQAGDVIQVQAFGTFTVANHYTKAEDDALLATKADKSTTYTKAEDDAKFVAKTDVIAVANGGTGKTTEFRKGFIEGFRLLTVGDNAITVTAGAAYIPGLGKIVELTANKVYTGLAVLASQSQHHFYLFESGGVADVEISLTAPVNYFGSAYNKTGDTSRRYLFSVLSGTTGFWPMRHDLYTGRMNFVTGAPGSSPFFITGPFTTTSPTLVSVVISNSGVNSLAPRETTTMLHTNASLATGSQFITAPADQAVAPAGSNWGNVIGSGSSVQAAFDIRPSRTSGSLGNYYVWVSSGSVNLYGLGYTFER